MKVTGNMSMTSRIAAHLPSGITRQFNRFQGRKRLLVTVLPLVLILAALVYLNLGLRSGVGPDEAFGTFDMPYEQTFDEVAVNRWFQHEGEWKLAKGALVQGATDVQSASIFVPRWLEEDTPYRLSVEVRLSETARAAGVNFNAQYPEIATQHQRVYVVREGGQLELVTGYIDVNGEFQTQTRMPVPQVADTFTLDVIVEDEVYHVQINGQPVVENRPLNYTNGLVGLYAADGPVTFDNLSVSELDGTYIAGAAMADETNAQPATADGLLYTSNFAGKAGSAGWVPFTGDWQVENGYLTQLDPAGYDFGIGYETDSFDAYTLRASFKHLNGQGAGVLFNMPSPYQLAGAHMVRYSDRSDNLLWGYFDETGSFKNQGYAPVPAPADGEHVLTITADGGSYSVALDGQPVVGSVPLMSAEGHVGLVAARSTAAFSMVEVSSLNGGTAKPVEAAQPAAEAQPTAAPQPTPVAGQADAAGTTDVVATGSGTGAGVDYALRGTLVDPNADTAWVPFGGEWQVNGDTLQQVAPNGFDLAAGYSGTTFQNYALAATLRHEQGMGGGILFNMAAPNDLRGAHMVRYSDTSEGGVFWGFYDDTGKFVGQGYARVTPAGTDAHTFTIVSGDSTYSVALDGQTLASNVKLNRNNGNIGLIASQSIVAYGPIDVSDGAAVEAAPAQTAVVTGNGGGNGTAVATADAAVEASGATNGDYKPLSGDWEKDGTTIRQTNPAVYDFINSTATFASAYTLDIDITLPEDPALSDAGGGVIFHMPERNKRNQGHMVRLTGPKSITWGYYDTTGAFVGQGKADLAKESLTHTLSLKVMDGKYDLLVDGDVVAAGIPLKTAEGWIGLLAYRGPITFDNIRITLGS